MDETPISPAPVSLETRLIWAKRVTDPPQRPRLHYRVGVTAWKLEAGSVDITSDRERLHFEAPCSLLLGAGWYTHVFSPGTVLCSVSVRVLSQGGAFFSLPQTTRLAGDLPAATERLIRYHEERAAPRDLRETALYRLRLHAALSQWCLELGEMVAGSIGKPFARPIGHAGLRAAMEWWHRQPEREKVTEPALARAAGLSVSHFKRVFPLEFGMSLREYRHRAKAEACIEALLQTDKSIKAIGFELGFSEPANFVRWFRQHFGQTPKEYRESR